MLTADWFLGGSLMHLLGTAELRGPTDVTALCEAIWRLVAGHDALRTVFARVNRECVARVLPVWRPALIEQRLRVPTGADPAEELHIELSRTTRQ
jgi:hypothetical protein